MNNLIISQRAGPMALQVEWNEALLSALTCACCLVVFGTLYWSRQRQSRSPLATQVTRLAIWGMLLGMLQALSAVGATFGGNTFVTVAMWVVVLAICLATATLVVAVPWAGITQDRQLWELAATELRDSKHRFELARQAAPGGWWEWRIPDNDLWCDSRFLEFLSTPHPDQKDEPLSRWEQILHPDDVANVYRELTQHLELPSEIIIDCRVRAMNDQYRWCRIKAVSIQQPDDATFIVAGSIQDIDDFRQTEEHLRHLSEYISQKHKMESLGEVTGNVAHEFKNVLQAISGQLQFAETHLPEESEARNELTMATNLIEQASEISEELLHFSGPGKHRAQLVTPNSILRSLELILQPMLASDIQLQVVPLARRVRVAAVSTALQQALLNLCLNARDAMPSGGTLTLSATLVRRRARAKKSCGVHGCRFVCFSVTDTGRGVPADIQSHLFEPFFTTKTPGHGTGLGLAIVREIATKHRGRVELSLNECTGAKFNLFVPAVTRKKDCPSRATASRWADHLLADSSARPEEKVVPNAK